VVAKQVGELRAVGGILVDAELEVLGEGVVELGVVILLLAFRGRGEEREGESEYEKGKRKNGKEKSQKREKKRATSSLASLPLAFARRKPPHLVLGDLGEELEALLDQVLPDDLEDLVLLQRLARDVEREVLGVDDAADEAEPLGDELLAVVLFFKGEIWEIFLSKKEEKKRKKLPLAAACRSKGERAKNQSQHNAP
jgi:hypothetical protein